MNNADVANYDIIRTKEDSHECSYDGKCPRFIAGSSGDDTYRAGSLFLSLRRKQVLNWEFAGRTIKKTFEEIVLSPDGRVGVLDSVRRILIA